MQQAAEQRLVRVFSAVFSAVEVLPRRYQMNGTMRALSPETMQMMGMATPLVTEWSDVNR